MVMEGLIQGVWGSFCHLPCSQNPALLSCRGQLGTPTTPEVLGSRASQHRLGEKGLWGLFGEMRTLWLRMWLWD